MRNNHRRPEMGVGLGLKGWVEEGRKNERNGKLRIEDTKEDAN